ncbi:hypothetical protein GCM10010103_40360 [Streptomyces paradoxus]
MALGGGEPAPPVQRPLLSAQFLPGVGRLGQVPVHTQAFAVVTLPAKGTYVIELPKPTRDAPEEGEPNA